MPTIGRDQAVYFRNQLRAARLAAIDDGEAFEGIIHAIERLGSYLTKEDLGDKNKAGSLHEYKTEVEKLARKSGMAFDTPAQFRDLLTPFDTLYKSVKTARNDAVHQGAFARHLTEHSISLAIILEEALSTTVEQEVRDFMVRNPVCAELWQPIGFVRQQMLAHSYSYLPVRKGEKWHIVSDLDIVKWLSSNREGDKRIKNLASTLEEALAFERSVEPIGGETKLDRALELLREQPVLLIKNRDASDELLGILTPFDLL